MTVRLPGEELLIGREAERAALDALAVEARAGDGAIVLLAGEAGVGKTMLARTVLAGSGLEVAMGFGVQEGASAYGPIVEALPELTLDAAPLDRATLFEAIRSLLAAAAARRPLALFLDDMQWADDATLGLLPTLARSLAAEPVLLVVGYRSDDVPRGHPVRRLRTELRRDHRLHEIAVEPFAADATAALLEHTLGAAAPALRDAVVDRTDGVPFFVAELGLALAGSERLRQGPEGLELPRDADLPLPESVRDAVLLRASGLSDAARGAIGVAAVAGQTVDLDAVMAIAGLDDWPSEPVVSGFLIEVTPGRLAFRHALVRDAFYGEIPWLERRELHRQVAERLEAPFQPAPPPSNPFDWGDEARVRELLGDEFDLELERHISPMHAPSGEAYWELFSSSYGPTKTLAENLGARREELHWAWVDFIETHHRTNGEITHPREYLLIVGTRR